MKKAKRLSLLIVAGALIMGGYLVNTKNNLQGGIVAKAEETEVDTKTPNKLSLTGKTADFYDGDSFTLGTGAKLVVTYTDSSTETLSEDNANVSYTINGQKINIGDKLIAKEHNGGKVVVSYTYNGVTKNANSYTLDVISLFSVEKGTWKLVTNESDLADGDKIVLASSSKGKTAGKLRNNNILPDLDSTFSDNYSTITSINPDTLIFELSKRETYWSFNNGDGDGLGSNKINLLTWNTNINWNISITSDGSATIANVDETIGILKYSTRANSTRFTTYAEKSTATLLPQIYKFVENDSSDKFIEDWATFRAKGGNEGICYYLKSENRAELDKMLARYDAFEDTSVIDTSEDITGITIGETIAYLKGLIAKENEETKSTSNSSIVLNSSLSSSTSLITIFAILGMASITGYYFIENKKKASK